MCDADTKETLTPPFDKLSNYDVLSILISIPTLQSTSLFIYEMTSSFLHLEWKTYRGGGYQNIETILAYQMDWKRSEVWFK